MRAVIITCPQCETKYRYDEARFGGADVKQVKCTSCSHSFEVRNPLDEPSNATSIGKMFGASPEVVEAAGVARRTGDPGAAASWRRCPRTSVSRWPSSPGRRPAASFPITKPRVYLGRGSAADVQVKDSEVSRKHAMLEVRGGNVFLVDLGATNGTWVGGERADEAEIPNQGEFTLGSTTLMLIVTGGPPAG